jgi:hypothetical protein
LVGLVENCVGISDAKVTAVQIDHPGHHEPLDGSGVQLYKRNVQAGLQKCSTEVQNNGLSNKENEMFTARKIAERLVLIQPL